jgi:NhaP-type Na+/H+ or K+/H+ antiporter
MIIPLGMGGGAVVGLLVAMFMAGTGEPEVRRPDDPGDALAMLGVFFMFAGAAAGTVLGVVVAVVLYLKRRREMKFK